MVKEKKESFRKDKEGSEEMFSFLGFLGSDVVMPLYSVGSESMDGLIQSGEVNFLKGLRSKTKTGKTTQLLTD